MHSVTGMGGVAGEGGGEKGSDIIHILYNDTLVLDTHLHFRKRTVENVFFKCRKFYIGPSLSKPFQYSVACGCST